MIGHNGEGLAIEVVVELFDSLDDHQPLLVDLTVVALHRGEHL